MKAKNKTLTVRLSHSETRTRDFFRFHLLRISKIRYLYYAAAFAFALPGCILAINGKERPAFFLFFLFVAVFILYFAMYKITLSRLVKKARPAAIRYNLVFSGDTIYYQVEGRELKYRFFQLVKSYETHLYYYFYIDCNRALALPKNVMTKDEKQVLDTIIEENNLKIYFKRFR